MIWYILYPFRGTTEAPDLPPTHPLCAVFSRYARYTARHVVSTLLISGVVATIFSYPIPYLFTHDFTSGASIIPYHVWTVAQPLPRDALTEPDIIMRSIWVHADYMQALNRDLLSSALELQNELLGPTVDFDPLNGAQLVHQEQPSNMLSTAQRDAVHAVNGLTNQSWLFHSPLLYWNCSNSLIMADPDIIGTVNDKKNQSTVSNITLRHSLVFSGKRFEDRKLLAADALVITLLHRRDSPIGRQWQQMSTLLSAKASDKWDIYPADGRVTNSRLYEFQFRPISSQDIASLAVAYGLALLYFLMSLSKLRAIKSKTGLTITVVTQIVFSIMSSFTICAVFNIDLSGIPRAAHPLVVLAMSLENIFRLINAVLVTPSDESSSNRIGEAFGQTAPTALESTTQNVLILLGLSRLVSPGVANFCIFAAIAIVFDFFYLSTFFLSVLSVDVRRMELGEALARASTRHKRNTSVPRDRVSWLGHFIRGKVALSTRIAGTVIMIGFVIIAQLHFFGEGRQLFGPTDLPSISSESKNSMLENVHQARSPKSWLRLQDHETAREVIKVIKPTAYSYTARVFDPLVFVLKNSDRMPHRREHNLLPAAYDFANHQLTHFVTFILLVGAGLRLLTSYLLWDDEEEEEERGEQEAAPLMSMQTFSGGHSLDIYMVTESQEGHIASVGLDRTIRVWNIRRGDESYIIPGADDSGNITLFPVLALAIDERSMLLAIVSSRIVRYWNLTDRCWQASISVENLTQKPESVFFDYVSSDVSKKLVIVQRDGRVTEIQGNGERNGQMETTISTIPVISSCHMEYQVDKSLPRCLLLFVIDKKGRCTKAAKRNGRWDLTELSLKGTGNYNRTIHRIESLEPLGVLLAVVRDAVFLVNAKTGTIVQTIETENAIASSIQYTYGYMRQQLNTRAIGITSLTVGYVEETSQNCCIRHFVPQRQAEAISLRRINPEESLDEVPAIWCTWEGAQSSKKIIVNPGKWLLVCGGQGVGIRRRLQTPKAAHNPSASGLRQRMSRRDVHVSQQRPWELWLASTGDRLDADETQPLFNADGGAEDHLFISELGPISKVGSNSAIFCFGNVIKLVTVGTHKRYGTNGDASGEALSVINRRRKPRGLSKPRS